MDEQIHNDFLRACMVNENKYYVYGLFDSRDGELLYIGKGCGNRAAFHQKIAEGKIKGHISFTHYIILCPDLKVIRVAGKQKFQKYFSDLSDSLGLPYKKRISGYIIMTKGHSKGYTLLRKYRPNRKKNKLITPFRQDVTP